MSSFLCTYIIYIYDDFTRWSFNDDDRRAHCKKTSSIIKNKISITKLLKMKNKHFYFLFVYKQLYNKKEVYNVMIL